MSLTPYKGISIARKDMDIIFNLSGYVGLDELNEDDWDKMTDGNEDTGTYHPIYEVIITYSY